MADWKDYYKEHLTTTEEVAKKIVPGDVLWMGQGPEIPFGLLEEMYAHMDDPAYNYHDIFLIWNVSTYPFQMLFDPSTKEHFRMTSFFNLPLERMSGEQGVMEYHSCGYDHLDQGFFEYGGNTVALHVCPPDEDGYCNFGHYGVSTTSLIANDPRVKKKIAFIDKTGQYSIPGDRKDVAIHVSEFDYIVEADTEVVEIAPAGPTEVDKRVAAFIMPHIKEGDKIQVGFGGLGEEILSNLRGLKDMEIYTEVACDSMTDLLQEGVISKITASSPGACSQRFFKVLSEDPRVKLLPRNKMIELFEIAKQDNIVAINATFMIDLLGQACSEAQGLTPYSGVGGSFAYIYGAMRSKGGRSFLCLRSTYRDANGDRQSIVVPWLPEGSIVTTPKNYQMFIVSEWGVADVYLKTMPDRIKALIKIAHPDFREWLKEKILTTTLITERDFKDYDLFDNVQ